jgi:outer membrane protein
MAGFARPLILLAVSLPLLLPLGQEADAQSARKAAFRIAVVDLNQALNNSEAGKRSKRILLTDKDQMEDSLKAQEAAYKKQSEDLRNNLLLTDAARAQREAELKESERKLRDAVQKAQKELQDKERRYTETIFGELKTVIGLIAKEETFDVVLEKGASQVILFSQYDMVDITDKVISRYDSFQKPQ